MFQSRSRLTAALQNRRQKKAAIQSRRSKKSTRLNFDQLESRNLLATFVVNSVIDDNSGIENGLLSLREAITAANTNAAFGDAAAGDEDGDVIVFEGEALILTNALVNGEYEITDDLIINGSGGQAELIINASNNSRIFNINTDELVGINDFVLINGTADRGGAILSEAGGTTRLNDIRLIDNTATGDDSGGGAIYTANGSLFATDLSANGNTANGSSGSGGAIFQASGTIGLFDALLDGNSANRAGGGIEIVDGSFFARDIRLGTSAGNTTGLESDTGPGNGGGLHITGTATASLVGGSVLFNEAASEGGGLWNQAGSRLFLSDVIVSRNSALGDAADQGGGGIFNNGGVVQITGDSLIASNVASGESGSGGGILSTDGSVFIVGTEISNNSANRAGGGIEIIDGSLAVRVSELSFNVAGPAGSAAPGNGGAFHVSGVANSRFIGGSITRNTAASEGGGLWNQAGSSLFVSNLEISNNVALGSESDNGGGGIFNNGGNLFVVSTIIFDNSADSTLSENDEGTTTSPGGSGGGIFSTSGNVFLAATDILENTAIRAGGGIEIIDGRFVAQDSNFILNTAGSENVAAPGNGGALHITGNDASVFIKSSEVSFNVAASEGGGLWNQSGSFLRVDGNSKIDLNEAGGDDADNGGGGIFNNGGNVSVLNSSIEANFTSGESGSGGGIFSVDGRVFVNESVISSNRANRAGGGVEIIDGRLNVIGSLLQNNSVGANEFATPGNGGALHVTGNLATVGFSSSLISDNTAANEGGGLWNQAGSSLTITGGTTIRENTAAGNAADDGGGGIFNNGGNLRIVNASITNNSATGALGSGGGIFSTDGQILINDARINGNSANGNGGGFEIIDGYTRLENTIVNSNTAGVEDQIFSNGGAVNVSGDDSRFVAIDSFFSRNEASNQGGGFWNNAGSTLVLRGGDRDNGELRVTSNTSRTGGGGIYNLGRLQVNDTFINNNSSFTDGGGLLNAEGGEAFFVRSQFGTNVAANRGGGVANFGTAAITDSFIINNFGDFGAGLATIGGDTTLIDNIFSANTSDDIFEA